MEGKEWTSLVGAIKAEKLSNEQKFVVITMERDRKILTKGMELSEITEALALGILHVAEETEDKKRYVNTFCEVLRGLV